MIERTLDRIPEWDPRSLRFAAVDVLRSLAPRSWSWPCRAQLDQGTEGACVGFAWAHELAANPVVVPVSDALARSIYREAQRFDEWPGESYEGTSVLAGAKVVQRLGHVPVYRWAFGVDEALASVSRLGPAIFGTVWMPSMFETRPSGLLEVDRSQRPAGGHAWLGRGVRLRPRLTGESSTLGPVLRLRNSWGAGWGVDGDAYLRAEDLEWLLSEQGECCVPEVRA